MSEPSPEIARLLKRRKRYRKMFRFSLLAFLSMGAIPFLYPAGIALMLYGLLLFGILLIASQRCHRHTDRQLAALGY